MILMFRPWLSDFFEGVLSLWYRARTTDYNHAIIPERRKNGIIL